MPLKTGGKGGMRQGVEGGERPRCELLFIPLESWAGPLHPGLLGASRFYYGFC